MAVVWKFSTRQCSVRDADGSYTHIDASGSVRTGGTYTYAGDFRESFAVVRSRLDGLCRHIDAEGVLLHPESIGFLELDPFHKGYARARCERGWYFVSKDGDDACRGIRYAALEPFYNGQAAATTLGGARQIISEEGVVLLSIPGSTRDVRSRLQTLSTGYWAPMALRMGLAARLPEIAASGELRRPPSLLDAHTSEHTASVALQPVAEAWREMGLLELSKQQPGASYSLTAMGSQLLPGSILLDRALYWLQPRYLRAWMLNDDALSASSSVTGGAKDSPAKEKDTFADVACDPALTVASRRVLGSHAVEDWAGIGGKLSSVLSSAANSEVTKGDVFKVIDVGGGAGELLKELYSTVPCLRNASLISIDRPEVTLLNQQQQQQVRLEPLQIQFLSLDMFRDRLPAGRVYLLSRVLHDWDDSLCLQLLSRVRDAALPGAYLFVIERVASPSNAHAMLSLHMSLLQGSRESREDEWTALFSASGWEQVRDDDVAPLSTVSNSAAVVPWRWHGDHAIYRLQKKYVRD